MVDHNFEKSKAYDSEAGCPAGYHKRRAYTNKKGTYVPPRCVRATTTYKESSQQHRNTLRRKMARRLLEKIPSIRNLSRKDCPPGMIPRKAYVRKYSTVVRQRGFTVRRKSGKVYRVYPKAAEGTMVETKCVKDLGLPGKGPRSGKGVGPLRKGELKKHGYSVGLSEAQRHAALKSAITEFGPLGVYRKLDAVAKLTVRTVPKVAAVFEADRQWIKANYGPMKAF